MGFFDSTFGRVITGIATGGFSETVRALIKNRKGIVKTASGSYLWDRSKEGGAPPPPELRREMPDLIDYDPEALKEQFTRTLGREPREDEMAFFSGFIKKGELQPYEVGQVLGATPEAQQQRFTQQRGEFEQLLAAGDERVLGQAGDVLTQRMLQQGRQTTGSGYTAAYFNAARDLAQERSSQLAQFYSGGLGDIRRGFQQAGATQIPRAFGLQAEKRGRQYQEEDFNRQLQLQNYYYDQQRRARRAQTTGQLIGGLGGAALGSFGGPLGSIYGAQFGSQIGGGIGGGFY
jgi:predicted Rdx family selenoprotein